MAQIEDLNEYRVKTLCTYLLYFPRNKPSKSVTVGKGRSIVLNDDFNVFRGVRDVRMSSRRPICGG